MMNNPTTKQHLPVRDKTNFAKCVSITGWGILTLILTVAVLLTTVAFTINFSMLGADISSQMVVLTGHRTRDWSSANSYSMHSAVEDRYSRLYVCMVSAEILVPGSPTYSSLVDFRDKAKHHHDCGAESDGGWPRDYGFLRCAQANFNATFHQSNVFLKCLDLSEGIMVETIQTPASTLFLGSYNFVTMLLASMGVMTAFLLFTAGGVCIEGGLKTPMKPLYTEGEEPKFIPSGYTYVAASQGWAPLAAVPVTLALLWSLFMFGTSMFYTFPPKDMWSDIVAVDGGSRALPGTPWTGFMCSGVSLVMAVYFASCLVEWYWDRGERKFHAENEDRSVWAAEQRANAAEAAIQAARDADAAAQNAMQAAQDAADDVVRAEDGKQPAGTRMRIQPASVMRVAIDKTRRARETAVNARRAALPPMPQPIPTQPQNSFGGGVFGGGVSGGGNGQAGANTQPLFPFFSSGNGQAGDNPQPLFPPASYSRQGPAYLPGPASNSVPVNWENVSRGYSIPANGGPPVGFVRDMYSAPKTQRRPTHLGIRYNPQLHYTDNTTTHMAPLLNKAFALTWVFADGLLFLGMLNGQNSLLNENVVAIWYYIIQCRGFQLAAAYFMDDVVFADRVPFDGVKASDFFKPDPEIKGGKGPDMARWNAAFKRPFDADNTPQPEPWNSDAWNLPKPGPTAAQSGLGPEWGQDDPNFSSKRSPGEASFNDSYIKARASQSKIMHAGIATACSQLASLWCMVIVLFHFINALSIPLEFNSKGVGNPTHAVQLAFIVIIVFMEICRHTVAFMAIYGHFEQKTYLNIIQVIFFMDWLIRAVFIVSTLFTVPFYLGDRNMKLFTYLL